MSVNLDKIALQEILNYLADFIPGKSAERYTEIINRFEERFDNDIESFENLTKMFFGLELGSVIIKCMPFRTPTEKGQR